MIRVEGLRGMKARVMSLPPSTHPRPGERVA